MCPDIGGGHLYQGMPLYSLSTIPPARRLVSKRAVARTVPLCLFPPSGPMEFVAMDLLGPLPVTPRGNRHVLVLTDRFTKLVIAVDLRNIRASTVALAYIARWGA
jgi:hypothetical protein